MVAMAERLRRQTRNLLGQPAQVQVLLATIFCHTLLIISSHHKEAHRMGNGVWVFFNVAEEGAALVVPGPTLRKECLHLLTRRTLLRVLFALGAAQLPPEERGPVEGVPQTQELIRSPAELQTPCRQLRQARMEEVRPRKIQQAEREGLPVTGPGFEKGFKFESHQGKPAFHQSRRHP